MENHAHFLLKKFCLVANVFNLARDGDGDGGGGDLGPFKNHVRTISEPLRYKNMLLNLNQLYKALTLATKTIIKYPNSSYTYYLLGKVCLEKKDSENGILNLKKAISLDEDNVEAKKLLQSLIRR